MNLLGNPQDKYRTIHIAGTNGKGSVSVALASILAQSGAAVGMTTSPHLHSLNERIVINGRSIGDEILNEAAERVMAADSARGLNPSFFEGITACAFVCFELAGVDWAVLEVGLGGRLDATNVISTPQACAIVSIDYDHQDILGNSLSKIAAEKAGIIKACGHPTFIGAMPDSARRTIEEQASQLGSELLVAERDFSWSTRNMSEGFIYSSRQFGSFEFIPALRGSHQGHNMAVAISIARRLGVSEERCAAGVASCFWPARLETVEMDRGRCIIDCAHNPAGIASLCNYLKENSIDDVTMVFGALNTKDWREMLAQLIPFVERWLILKPDSPSALQPEVILEYLSGIGIKAAKAPASYEDAAAELYEVSGTKVVAGSIYMVGGLRSLIAKAPKQFWQTGSTRSTS